MIFRIQIDGFTPEDAHLLAMVYSATGELPKADSGKGVMTGLMGNPRLNQMMLDLGLPKPDVSNPRARFYFTVAGWKKYGRILFSEAKQLGHTMKMMSHKDPLPSQIVYEDKFQIAILPLKKKRRADLRQH